MVYWAFFLLLCICQTGSCRVTQRKRAVWIRTRPSLFLIKVTTKNSTGTPFAIICCTSRKHALLPASSLITKYICYFILQAIFKRTLFFLSVSINVIIYCYLKIVSLLDTMGTCWTEQFSFWVKRSAILFFNSRISQRRPQRAKKIFFQKSPHKVQIRISFVFLEPFT